MTSILNTSWEYPRMHVWYKFGASSPNLWRVIAGTSQISWNSESKWPKWPWRSRSMTFIFNTNREYPRIHVWCKFGDSSPNLWWHRADKVKFMDGRRDGQMDRGTDAGNDNTPSAWKGMGYQSPFWVHIIWNHEYPGLVSLRIWYFLSTHFYM